MLPLNLRFLEDLPLGPVSVAVAVVVMTVAVAVAIAMTVGVVIAVPVALGIRVVHEVHRCAAGVVLVAVPLPVVGVAGGTCMYTGAGRTTAGPRVGGDPHRLLLDPRYVGGGATLPMSIRPKAPG